MVSFYLCPQNGILLTLCTMDHETVIFGSSAFIFILKISYSMVAYRIGHFVW